MTAIGRPLSDAEQGLCAPGSPYELAAVTVDGQHYRLFAQTPDTMRGLLDVARAHGDSEFLCYVDANGEKQRRSFCEYFQRVDALAHGLVTDFGLQQGQRVAIAMRNTPEWLEVYAAVVSLGAIVVPLNSWGSADDLQYVLHDSAPGLVVCDGPRYALINGVLTDIGCRAIVARADVADAMRYETVIARHIGHAMPTPWHCHSDDPVQIMYSSGTSGRPKGAVSSHRNIIQAIFSFEYQAVLGIMANPDALDTILSCGDRPTALLAVPLFHVSGCYASFLLHLRGGRRMVMMYKWQAEQALTLIEQEKITIFSAAPSMLIDLLQHPRCEPQRIASLFSIGSGGAACPERVRQLIGDTFAQSYTGTGYGMTESNAIGSSCVGIAFDSKPGSAGTLSPLVEFKTCNTEGDELPVGQQGEIHLRSVCNSRVYWGQNGGKPILDAGGWLATGDIGYIDHSGFVFVTDRAKDMIIRGGENIHPAEIEARVSQHPDIVECAAFALPDPLLGECVALAYRTQTGEPIDPEVLHNELLAQLAAYKRPTQIVALTSPLPRSPSGKVLKGELPALVQSLPG